MSQKRFHSYRGKRLQFRYVNICLWSGEIKHRCLFGRWDDVMLQITPSHTGHTLSLSIVKLHVAHWWASQPDTRRNCYFCLVFLNWDWRSDINKHKYFQKAAFSGFFPLIQRAASYYSVKEQTRTPTNIWSKELPATTMQCTLKMTAELGDVCTDPKAPARASRWLWQPSRCPCGTARPHPPAAPSPHPLLIPPPPHVCTHAGTQPIQNPGVRKQFICLERQNQANLKHARVWNSQGAWSRAAWVAAERTQTWRWKSFCL